jgi:uncharacterized protein YbjT (DUF2867 family)
MIVVFGATGSTGPHLVRRLLERGAEVRVAARDPGRARGALGALGSRVSLVQADLERPETLAPALAGGRALYAAIGGATGTQALVEAEGHLIDAAAEAGVPRYVKVSGVDAAPDAPARIQRWHGELERHLRASGVPSTVLRPGFFMQNFLGLSPAIRAGALPLPTGQARAALIDARDIADVAAVTLTTDGHEGEVYTLSGPEALSHADVAELMTRELGRSVQFHDVPPSVFLEGCVQSGMPTWFASLLTDVYVHLFAAGGAARVTRDVERVTGQPPRSLTDFLRDHRAAFGA